MAEARVIESAYWARIIGELRDRVAHLGSDPLREAELMVLQDAHGTDTRNARFVTTWDDHLLGVNEVPDGRYHWSVEWANPPGSGTWGHADTRVAAWEAAFAALAAKRERDAVMYEERREF